jgi:UDP-N-acetylmuramoyl-L-alanyl-D-glutamate--2,6-diaminopimelate ligase
MPGRFFMQKFLYDAVQAGCEFAVVEMTSEGSKQFRHKFIYTDAFVFTNLSPEHIESHGSYEAYRQAKVRMVHNLKKKNGVLIVNSDDAESSAFTAAYKGPTQTYSLFEAENIVTEPSISFTLHGEEVTSPLQGKFNAYNILAAIKTCRHFDIPLGTIQKALATQPEIAGRVQKIENELGAEIVVDYAHTPDSLIALYESFKDKRTVCILGNTGGGRDTWKRPKMAEIANSYCDHVILANEDPYDEDPMQIINDMKGSVSADKLEIILDRKEAIAKGISMLKHGDALLITGKGTDPYIK